jgi:dihydroorotate dehydrogenase electron transfer subunit
VRRVLTEIAELRPAGQTTVVRVAAPAIAALGRPGQFVQARAAPAGRWDPLLRRPRWVARVEGEDVWLWGADEGARLGQPIDLLGPLGRGFEIAPSSRSLLLVGQGDGLGPLLALADQAAGRELSVTLLAGFPSAERALPAAWVAPQVEYLLATADGSAGHAGAAVDLVPDYLGWADEVFAGGPPELPGALARAVAGTSKRVQVALDGWRGCGTGLCDGCLVRTGGGPRRVCRDGPVFALADLR